MLLYKKYMDEGLLFLGDAAVVGAGEKTRTRLEQSIKFNCNQVAGEDFIHCFYLGSPTLASCCSKSCRA